MFGFLKKKRGIDEEPIAVVNDPKTLSDAPGIDLITKNELIDIANQNGIKINTKLKKAEIYKQVFGG